MDYLKDYLNLGKTCNRCGTTYPKLKQHMYFYNSHRWTIELNICKTCIKDMLDINNNEQIKLVLEALDMPFIEDEWNKLIDRYGKESNVLGRYIAKMNLCSFRNYTYKDSEFLNETNTERKNGEQKIFV